MFLFIVCFLSLCVLTCVWTNTKIHPNAIKARTFPIFFTAVALQPRKTVGTLQEFSHIY